MDDGIFIIILEGWDLVKYNSEGLNLISESLGAIDVTDVARQLRKQYMDLARH